MKRTQAPMNAPSRCRLAPAGGLRRRAEPATALDAAPGGQARRWSQPSRLGASRWDISPRHFWAGGVGLLGLVLTACGAQGLQANFEPGWRADGPSARRQDEGNGILTRLDGAQPATQVPAVVGLSGRGLHGRALPDGQPWHFEGAVDVLPSLAADVVGFSGDGNVTVLDVRTGIRLFSLPVSGRRLEGLSSDGKFLVLLLVDSDDARPDQVLILTRKGRTVATATAVERVGTPLALSGIGLLPWNSQYVAAFDLATGAPLGTLLVQDGVHRVVDIDGAAWVMGAGASRIDAHLLDTTGRHSLRLPLRGLPGKPVWPVDGSKPRLPRGTPVSVWAHPEDSRRPRFSEGTFVFGYFDIVMGLDAHTQQVRFANFFERAILGGSANRWGVSVCLEDGSVHAVRIKDGVTEKVSGLTTRLKGCVVTGLERTARGEAPLEVPSQIQRTVRRTSPTLAAAHNFLLADLAKQEGDAATRALLAVARDPLTSAALGQQAADYLSARRDGASAMLAALTEGAQQLSELNRQADNVAENARARQAAHRASSIPVEPDIAADARVHAAPEAPLGQDNPDVARDQLEPTLGPAHRARLQPETTKGRPASEQVEPQTGQIAADEFELPAAGLRPPPVAALALALSAMKVTAAAPVLTLYLQMPTLDGHSTLAIIEALLILGDQAQLPALRDYFFRFKNAGGDANSIRALTLAAEFLLRLEDEAGRDRVVASKDDILTHPEVKKALTALLARSARPATP